VRKELSPERPHFAHPAFDMENRIVTAQIGELTVASIYVPNGGKDFRAKLRFLEALKAYAAAFQSTNDALVLCGDLNIARAEIDVHPSERRNVIGQLPQERAWFDQLLGNDLIDIGRALHPDDDRMYTWWAPWRGMRQRNIGWRLDYVLATTSLADRVNACGAAREFGTSDHAPLLADFEL
jgi:exodeoxyribonuclease-3